MKRARVMYRFKELLEKNSDKICQLIGEEHGKIHHDTVGDDAADTPVCKMKAAMAPLKVGACSNRKNDFGPVLGKAHQEKVVGYINSSEQQGGLK